MGFLLNFTSYVVLAFITLLTAIYLYFKYSYTYWKRKSIVGPEPNFPEGNFTGVFTKKKHISDPFLRLYPEYKHKPFIGIYLMHRPVLMVNDLEIIKNVMLKDFEHFSSHGGISNNHVDPLSENLFNLSGERWKDMRTKLSPMFTSGKMKMMTGIMAGVQKSLMDRFARDTKKSNVVNVKEVIACYTVDIIGNCAFGLECDSLVNPNPEFLKYGKMGVQPPHFKEQLGFLFGTVAPRLAEILRWSSQPPEMVKFFQDLVHNTVKYREENKVNRNDLLQMLIQLKNQDLRDDTGKLITIHGDFSLPDLVAQSFIFFLAGFETSSSAASYALFHLAQETEVQERARAEMMEVLGTGPVTYEALQKLPYLDMVVEETLRLHPVLNFLFRECTKPYRIPGHNVTIEKGTLVHIPLIGIQTDPDLFPEPDRFVPERFTKEEKIKRHKAAYMPFGEGPRLCIGMRFAMMQVRLALTGILSKYQVSICKETQLPLELDIEASLVTTPKEMYLQLTPIA